MRLGVAASLVGTRLVAGDVEVEDGRVVAYGLASPNGAGIAAPGFVDLQVNGFGGVDFLDADADGYRRAGEALLETGVTAYLPTLITSPEEHLLAALREVPLGPERPRILGVHLEGPFLSPRRLGTHDAGARRDPDPQLLERLLDGGPVRAMTLAPEQANAAFDRGVRTVTHLFNAMRPFLHRDPGIVGAALARDDVTVQIILDGVHLAPETAQVVWRAAPGRVALVTDAITAAGGTDGSYSFGSLDVQVHDGAVRGPDGVLAGSVLTMIQAVRNLHALGVPLPDALGAATAVPAGVLGLREVGRLDVGLPADVVILDDSLEIARVLVAGEVHVAA